MCACVCVYYITNVNQMILGFKSEKHCQRSGYIYLMETVYAGGPFHLFPVCDCILDS